VAVANYISIRNRTSFYLENVYTSSPLNGDQNDNHTTGDHSPCTVTIGPYMLTAASSSANTTLDIAGSLRASCSEPLRPSCQRLSSAVCRIDSAFDDTDSFVCRERNEETQLLMHDGSAGTVFVWQRIACDAVPTAYFVPEFCRS
jgi:hypothetical protein